MKKRVPKYSLHRATGQARVYLDGKSVYLGPFGSDESKKRYDEIVADLMKGTLNVSNHRLTIAQLCVAYVTHAKAYYVKNGRVTSEVSNIQTALRPLVKLHGRCLVREFGPAKLKMVREKMIEAGIFRKSVNRGMGRIKRMFRWGVENELVSPHILASISAVTGLRYGRSAATEGVPVKPVPADHIEAIRPYVNGYVWAMIQLQLATGMRPGEVRLMRSCDINRDGSVWEYLPMEHKTEHHGRQRKVYIGPRGQQILAEFLVLGPTDFVFSPILAEEKRQVDRRVRRATKVQPSQLSRQRKETPLRTPGETYTIFSYGRAIRNACVRAGVPIWTPNQLRHNAATELRKQFDIETVRTVLGHATGFTTEVYAELDFAKAKSVVERVG